MPRPPASRNVHVSFAKPSSSSIVVDAKSTNTNSANNNSNDNNPFSPVSAAAYTNNNRNIIKITIILGIVLVFFLATSGNDDRASSSSASSPISLLSSSATPSNKGSSASSRDEEDGFTFGGDLIAFGERKKSVKEEEKKRVAAHQVKSSQSSASDDGLAPPPSPKVILNANINAAAEKKDASHAVGDSDAKPSSSSPSSSSYIQFVHTLLLDELGIELATALYDPYFFDAAARFINDDPSSPSAEAASSSSSLDTAVSEPHIDPYSLFLIEKNRPWVFRTMLEVPSLPTPLHTMATRLMTLKQTTSLAIARLVRDGRLAKNWEDGASFDASSDSGGDDDEAGSNTRGNDNKNMNTNDNNSDKKAKKNTKAYTRPIRTAITGFASYAIAFLQVLIDGEGKMPDLTEWAREHNNAFSRRLYEKNGEGGAYTDVSDPIVHAHLDPLINLLQMIRIRPIASSPSPSAADAKTVEDLTVAAIEAQSKKLRNAAVAANKNKKVRLGDESINTFADVLSEDKSAVFKGILQAHSRRPSLSSASASSSAFYVPTALVECIGYNTLLWNNRIDVLNAVLAVVNNNDDRATQPEISVSANRAQYALQYFSNSHYHRWNKKVIEGRFWNSIRPVVGCGALMKLCEEPDGCRYLCNVNYLLSATPVFDAALIAGGGGGGAEGGSSSSSSSSSSRVIQYAHQAIGFGSNNEYDWELGLVDAFKRAAPAGVHSLAKRAKSTPQKNDDKASSPHHQQPGFSFPNTLARITGFSFPNTLARITVFDCTLKEWKVPPFLANGTVGFGHASYCLGLKDVSPIAAVREAEGDGKNGVAVVGFSSMRKFINSDGVFPSNYVADYKTAITSSDPSKRPPNPFFHRYSVRGSIAKNVNAKKVIVHNGGDGGGGGASAADDVNVPSPLYVDYTTFDEVSILKLDVEGFEHVSFPSFLRSELRDLNEHYIHAAKQQSSSGTAASPLSSDAVSASPSSLSLVFFDSDAPDSPTISQLGMEFHRQGHKSVAGAGFVGALRAHYSLMMLYSKGFLMFAQERNPVDSCCYEIALTHYRHFVRSEVWLALRS